MTNAVQSAPIPEPMTAGPAEILEFPRIPREAGQPDDIYMLQALSLLQQQLERMKAKAIVLAVESVGPAVQFDQLIEGQWAGIQFCRGVLAEFWPHYPTEPKKMLCHAAGLH